MAMNYDISVLSRENGYEREIQEVLLPDYDDHHDCISS